MTCNLSNSDPISTFYMLKLATDERLSILKIAAIRKQHRSTSSKDIKVKINWLNIINIQNTHKTF